MYSDQEEADYRILRHLNNIPSPSNIVVRTTDTDILAILIGNHHNLAEKHIWMEVGNFANNSLRFIDVTLLVENLGVSLSKAMPAFHAFTGCDYSPAFIGKGKVRPFELLVKDPACQEAFSKLNTNDIDEDIIDIIQGFTCKLYGNKNSSINEVIVQKFFKAFSPKKNSESILEKVKGSDGSSFPPCFGVLYQHILRTRFIAALWSNQMELPSPLDFGWEINDNMFEIKWFDGEQYPANIDIAAGDTSSDDENRDDELQYESDDDESADDDDETDDFSSFIN